MEKEEKDILKKIRSSRACIRDGYQLFTGNFRKLFRMTWPVAIGFAVVSAIAIFVTGAGILYYSNRENSVERLFMDAAEQVREAANPSV